MPHKQRTQNSQGPREHRALLKKQYGLWAGRRGEGADARNLGARRTSGLFTLRTMESKKMFGLISAKINEGGGGEVGVGVSCEQTQ